jgi:hypothetical protein
MFPPYSFTLDSTTMNSSHLFDNVDAYSSISSLLDPTIACLSDIYNDQNTVANPSAKTYNNIISTRDLIDQISSQIQNSMQDDIQKQIQNAMSVNGGTSGTTGTAGTAGTAGTSGAAGITQSGITGVSNVFAPNIIINPVVPQSSYESMAFQQ